MTTTRTRLGRACPYVILVGMILLGGVLLFMAWYKGLNDPMCELTDIRVLDAKFNPDLTLRMDYEFKCRNREPVTRVKFTRFDVGFRFRNSLMLRADSPQFTPFEVPVKESYLMKRSALVSHRLTDEDKQALAGDFEVGDIPVEIVANIRASHGLGKLRMDRLSGQARCYIKLVTPHKEATRAEDIVVDKINGCHINLSKD